MLLLSIGVIVVILDEMLNSFLGVEFGFQAESIGAVSYTHLRAHETVLDLVCRLLLEKKKKTHNNLCCLLNTQRRHILLAIVCFHTAQQETQ